MDDSERCVYVLSEGCVCVLSEGCVWMPVWVCSLYCTQVVLYEAP